MSDDMSRLERIVDGIVRESRDRESAAMQSSSRNEPATNQAGRTFTLTEPLEPYAIISSNTSITWAELQDRTTVSIKIKQMLQQVHNQAPKDRSADFYEGLSLALSLMEQQA